MTPVLRAKGLLLVVLLATLLSGCSWTGLNSVALPFTKGGGDDNVEITVQLENAANLVPNSEVKYGEVTIGSVRKIELKDWVATLTVGLDGDVPIPADVTAKVAQKSLLGAEYLELKDPADREEGTDPGTLATGAVIGRERTSRYPETEEVLSAASMLLNNGGLPQLQTIAHELNDALGGRDRDLRSFMQTVSRFTARLDGQRDNIAATLKQLNRLSTTVVEDQGRISRMLEELPKGFAAIAEERKQLVRTLKSLDEFGVIARRVIRGTKQDLQENLDNLARVTKQLADHGDTLAHSFDALTYPFNVRGNENIGYGDYLNLITEVEVSADHLTQHWLGGTPLDGLFTGILGGTPTATAAGAADPLSAPSPGAGQPPATPGEGKKSGQEQAVPAPEAPPETKDLLSNLLSPLLGGR